MQKSGLRNYMKCLGKKIVRYQTITDFCLCYFYLNVIQSGLEFRVK